MAQSATKERALLGIEPFWEKSTLEPPLRWDRWQIMLKLAIMAKECISIDTLLTIKNEVVFEIILPSLTRTYWYVFSYYIYMAVSCDIDNTTFYISGYNIFFILTFLFTY